MGWIQDLVDPKSRRWEEFYRNRWQHDQVVRSTHGVNCTGGCSWAVYVKDGIITWEMQQTDYPLLEKGLPPYEPRGCQRGISASWYVYSPIRVKYPYIRGPLLDFWRKARAQHSNPVEAWASIAQDEQKRKRYQRARGKGGFRRTTWDEAVELISAACLYTAKKWGPDRIMGFAPIPAFSFVSYAGGARFLQLIGGVNMSFYDWYADLPNAFPEVWGDQTDVCESADWYNSSYIVSIAANLNMTRTPDVHFISEARVNGSKFVVIAPDFSQVAKYSDMWIPVKAGQDNALWMAVNHVILKEYHADRTVPYFDKYVKQYTDAPLLVELSQGTRGLKPGQHLRANRLGKYANEENGDWKMLMMDRSGTPKMPMGTVGFRWQKKKGQWNLKLEDGQDGSQIDPLLTFIDKNDEVANVEFYEFADRKTLLKGVPIRYVETSNGRVPVATVYDLMLAFYGVSRGLPGDYPKDYDDVTAYTPAWQEQYTGIGRETCTRFAREFATNAEHTNGRSMCITGASLNHWYSNGLCYRGPIVAMMFTGCCGVNGGGMNHYVGQEKLAPAAPWVTITFALDWTKPPRRQQSPTWHYVNSAQWHYEGEFTEYAAVPPDAKWAKGHAMDIERDSVKRGWMPHYPQFDKNPLEIVRDAQAAGAKDDAAIIKYTVEQLKTGKLNFSVEDPDAEVNWPRVWIIWRGNAIMASAKGHEFFLRHYLGTHDNAVAEERASTKKVKLREPAPRGKFDLVCDINFRMDTSALYSDIVLPTAMWYEKNDLNSTDLHSFIHPLGAAVPPVWESKADWDIFKTFAKKLSDMAPQAFSEPIKDLVAFPLAHDTPDEIAQPAVKDWDTGEIEAIPGVTMPHLRVVTRDYTQVYNRYVTLGPNARTDGMSFNGVHIDTAKFYDQLLENPISGSPDPRHMRCLEWNGQKYPSLEDPLDACNAILHFAPETNGEVAYTAWEHEAEATGMPLTQVAEPNRNVRMTFFDLTRQVRRLLISPVWTGMVNDGRAYSAWCTNVDLLIPWRTVTGREQFYMDHPWYIDFGEHFPTYKPKLDPHKTGDVVLSPVDEKSLILNYITPHGKWHIHSTYYDNLRMLTLSRGIEPVWINDKDAARIGVVDNQWMEVYNDNGVMVTRAAVSARVQPGTCMIYHSPERTISMPKSQIRGGRRAGGHNSLTRTRINPLQLAGGYGQWTYGFNYWGPIGIFTRDTHVCVRALEKLEW
ncbi:MAG: nitrate reductase subunit alpha [Candidatus Eremiobacteraeota bacterium]|nr:nitrate reductase subunit alpha [Candidatus Eremiobacteraeota bacterium]MBV8354477.1 nitrate reductase subunit alpha [Candidatus Eremiobacteraeota bacterium]